MEDILDELVGQSGEVQTMTYAKHTAHTDALDTLGSIIGPDEGRDAIHLAVFNAVAGVALSPGTHVALDDDKITAKAVPPGEGVGIVDPFLLKRVMKGDNFWLVVYPRQITSLHHVWEHPAFASASAEPPAGGSSSRAASEAWLRNFCATADCPSFESVVGKCLDGSRSHWDSDGEYLHFDGMDAHGEIPAVFWDHMEVYTGRKFGHGERPSYFSCSC